MKVVILAGGFGTRLGEKTALIPKPMVEIADKPIVWHIMNIYFAYGFREFIIALGYKKEVIKEYFLNYRCYQNDLTIGLKDGKIDALNTKSENWIVHLVDTGLNTMTGGRIWKLKDKLAKERFMLTYGDGVGDVDINKLIKFHKSHGKIATVTTVRPTGRFGGVVFAGNKVREFKEKTQLQEGWINGGFFIFEPEIFKYLHSDDCILEGEPLENLAKDGQLMGYKHEGFWQCMDTLRDKELLEELWKSGNALWKIWEDRDE